VSLAGTSRKCSLAIERCSKTKRVCLLYSNDSFIGRRCLTQVKYDADPEEILGKLVFIFEKLWKIVVHKDIENYTIRVICDKENLPKVDALVRVVRDEKEELSVLEFRSLGSNDHRQPR